MLTATETSTDSDLDFRAACLAADFCDKLAEQHNNDAARAARAGDQALCEWHCARRDEHEAMAIRYMA